MSARLRQLAIHDRQEIIRQLLADWNDQIPNTPEEVLNKRDGPITEAYRHLNRALYKLQRERFELYLVVQRIYLHEYAGHADREFYARKFGPDSPLMQRERLAVIWLAKELRSAPLAANFPDRPKPKRPASLRNKYPDMARRFHELKKHMKPTPALERTADEFGVSISTVKRADRWSRGQKIS